MNKSTAENPSRTLWRDAAADGGIIGAMLFVVMLFDDFSGHEFMALAYMAKIVVLAGGIYIFTKRRSLKYPDRGFSLKQGMSYIVAMMVFAGFITGAENYLAISFISPEYYQPQLTEARLIYSDALASLNNLMGNTAFSNGFTEAYIRQIDDAMNSPASHIISGVIGKVIAGIFFGTFVTPMVKRQSISGEDDE